MCVFSKNKFQIVRLYLNNRKSCDQLDKKHPKAYIWASINMYSCEYLSEILKLFEYIRSLKFYIWYKAEGVGEDGRVQKWQTFLLYIFILLYLLTCIWILLQEWLINSCGLYSTSYSIKILRTYEWNYMREKQLSLENVL